MAENKVPFVKKQYELWPYPQISLVAGLHRDSLWQINYEWMARRLGRSPEKKPKIWIAGCGTFQPYLFSRANPEAQILATDLSEASLKKAKNRCRFHGIKNIQFQSIDLSNPDTLPEEKFDLIECYGVLMSLPAPEKALGEFAKRLKPNGILRVMVYTHYGRQRVFQIQRLAKLLGLSAQGKNDPKILKQLMGKLPKNHPLKSTFFDYPDSTNLPGIVDGFLHASDQGFTGEQISQLLDKAGFDLGFCFHRPWGQPANMAEKLGLSGFDRAFWLHYLDLWQSLKSNFILCCTLKSSEPSKITSTQVPHPLFDWNRKVGLRHKLRLAKLALSGVRLQTRTHDQSIRLNSSQVRSLLRAEGEDGILREILAEETVTSCPFFETGSSFARPSDPWMLEAGRRTPNPMYRHLFDAYTFRTEGLPSLKIQLEKWKGFVRPLEDDDVPWGLTPWTTYQHFREPIEAWLGGNRQSTEANLHSLQLKEEGQKLSSVKKFLSGIEGIRVPAEVSALRELWTLLLSYRDLFWEVEIP